MLLRFSCGNFLSFKEEKTLDLTAVHAIKELYEDNVFSTDRYKLLKSAVLYGANASGKSNLFRAIKMMKWLVINSSKNLQKGESLEIEHFKLSTMTIEKPSTFEITVLINNEKYRYGFEADNQKVTAEWLFHGKKIKEDPLFIREAEGIQVFPTFNEGKGLEARTRENALFISVCAQFNGKIAEKIITWFRNCNIISGIEDKAYQMFSENMYMNNQKSKELIMEMLRRADMGIKQVSISKRIITDNNLPAQLPVELKKILVNKEESIISILHDVYDDRGKSVSSTALDFETHESEGSKKYFRLSGPIIDTLEHGKILIVDELDTRLHPLLTLEIVRLFNSQQTNPHNAQLIFATHDTNLLSSQLFRRDQIWFTEKDHLEATDLYSLAAYKLPTGKVRNDASFEKDYIRGRYGAIPYVGNFQDIIWGDNG